MYPVFRPDPGMAGPRHEVVVHPHHQKASAVRMPVRDATPTAVSANVSRPVRFPSIRNRRREVRPRTRHFRSALFTPMRFAPCHRSTARHRRNGN